MDTITADLSLVWPRWGRRRWSAPRRSSRRRFARSRLHSMGLGPAIMHRVRAITHRLRSIMPRSPIITRRLPRIITDADRRRGGRPSREQAALLGERILDTATELFLAEGYGATSIEAIAQRAGISKRTFYHR